MPDDTLTDIQPQNTLTGFKPELYPVGPFTERPGTTPMTEQELINLGHTPPDIYKMQQSAQRMGNAPDVAGRGETGGSDPFKLLDIAGRAHPADYNKYIKPFAQMWDRLDPRTLFTLAGAIGGKHTFGGKVGGAMADLMTQQKQEAFEQPFKMLQLEKLAAELREMYSPVPPEVSAKYPFTAGRTMGELKEFPPEMYKTQAGPNAPMREMEYNFVRDRAAKNGIYLPPYDPENPWTQSQVNEMTGGPVKESKGYDTEQEAFDVAKRMVKDAGPDAAVVPGVELGANNKWVPKLMPNITLRIPPFTPSPGGLPPGYSYNRRTGDVIGPDKKPVPPEELAKLGGIAAEYGANKKTLATNVQRETLTRDFVNRIDYNIQTIHDLQKKYGPNYGKFFNQALNMIKRGTTGSGDLESLRLAIVSTSNEVSKIESGSLGIAGASVDQMRIMGKIHDVNLNPKDMDTVLNTSSTLGHNSINAIVDENKRLKGELGIEETEGNKNENKRTTGGGFDLNAAKAELDRRTKKQGQ